ncbi:MAG: hypothetical protein P8Z81_01095 [Deinococcales bacterium]
MIGIELVYFEGCRSWQRAWTELGRALVDLGLDASVRLCNVDRLGEDERSGFAGSPTIRIEGWDLEGYAGAPVTACRRYLDNDGKGWPSQALLRERLRTASAERAKHGLH